MRMIAYILIIILLFVIPVQPLDVAKLQPVEALAVYEDQGTVVVLTDTEDKGVGQTVRAALENLKETTAAVIYLDTAEYLLLAEGTESYAKEFEAYLKPSVKVRQYYGGEVKEEVKFLDAHDRSANPENGKN